MRLTLKLLRVVVAISCILALASPGSAQQTRPQTHPADDGPALSERQASLLLQLADAEANIRAINQALVRTGYQVGQAYSRIETSEKGNELMDRKGGGPVGWQDFYGKTARSFVMHDRYSTYRAVPRPRQFDFIYKANDQQAADARKQIASLAQNQAELLARRQKHEADQSYLWATLAWEQIKDREISLRPLYRFQLAGAGGKANLLRGPILFLRTISKSTTDALESVEVDQPATFADLNQHMKAGYAALQESQADALLASGLADDDRKRADALKVFCKQLAEQCAVAADNYRQAMDRDRAHEDNSKLEFRAQLQSSLARLSTLTAELDEQLTNTAQLWSITPQVGVATADALVPWTKGPAGAAPTTSAAPANSTEAAPAPIVGETPKHVGGGWVDLFNGHDIKGWTPVRIGRGTMPQWTVEDGILIGRGVGGYLGTPRSDYTNFQVHIEAMINESAESGIFLRIDSATHGYKAGIDGNANVKTGSILGRFVRSDPILAAVTIAPIKPNQWFTMDVICDGAQITTIVNGKQTATWTDPQRRHMQGAIGLRSGGASTVVKFRTVQVKELPMTK